MAKPKIGEILVRGGYLTPAQVGEVMREQVRSKPDARPRFGEIALRKRLITSQQLRWALAEQAKSANFFARHGKRLLTAGVVLGAAYAAFAMVPAGTVSGVASRALSGSVTTVGGDGGDLVRGLHGKVVLLNFWATWCGPCAMETPDLVKLHRTYQARGFTVVGLSVEGVKGDPRDIPPFIKEYGIPYPVHLASMEMLGAWGANGGIPESILLDRQGKEVQRYLGTRDFGVFEKDLLAVL